LRADSKTIIEAKDRKEHWREEVAAGMRVGLPLAIGYLPTALTFGMLSQTAGIPAYVAVLMSLIVYAGASQFVGINMLTSAAAAPEIVLATFILNFRLFLMTTAIARKLEPTSRSQRALVAFGVTDESFAVASMRSGGHALSVAYMLGLNSIGFLAWNAGTWLGLILSEGLPTVIQNSMGVSLYVMFIALLVPGLRTSRPALGVAAIAVLCSCVLVYAPLFQGLGSGWRMIMATVIASACGAVFWKEGLS
jgi:4-azaleucine resistance transporter AzlC